MHWSSQRRIPALGNSSLPSSMPKCKRTRCKGGLLRSKTNFLIRMLPPLSLIVGRLCWATRAPGQHPSSSTITPTPRRLVPPDIIHCRPRARIARCHPEASLNVRCTKLSVETREKRKVSVSLLETRIESERAGAAAGTLSTTVMGIEPSPTGPALTREVISEEANEKDHTGKFDGEIVESAGADSQSRSRLTETLSLSDVGRSLPMKFVHPNTTKDLSMPGMPVQWPSIWEAFWKKRMCFGVTLVRASWWYCKTNRKAV
jgi:hypothetical protein